MDSFEKQFDACFPVILKKTGAILRFMYPPTRFAGQRGSMPVFVQVGRAVFDVFGWKPTQFEGLEDEPPVAVAVGIELKRNGDRHTSMRIVGEDGSGSGLQSHQLEALASLHRAGGIARLLWNNGGETGVLDGEDLAAAYFAYGVSVQAVKLRKTVSKGSRSIAWSTFRKVDLNTDPSAVLIAPESKTVAEVLKISRRKARKKTQEAFDEEAARPSKLAAEMDDLIIDD